jgi:UDP-3-O-[3-hydroxymyristoyl] N-acetylglucosamine deacetylase/3-hydroxyacyl-[acyl-carrier-protein] dehydratase
MNNTVVKQRTLQNEVTLKGIGLHTGKEVTITFKPAAENHGYAFSRTDLEGNPIIKAKAEYVTETQRGTNLEFKGIQINTSEHVLSALVGLEVDNCLIEMNSPEPPIMDGSSKFFVEAIETAGIIEQKAERDEYIVKDVISYVDEASGCEIMIMPSDEYQVTTMVDYGTEVLGTQNATLKKTFRF